MWEPTRFFDLLEPRDRNVVEAFRLSGRLDALLLRRAFGALAVRHEKLRASFVEGSGQALQRVPEGAHIPLESIDLTCEVVGERSVALLTAEFPQQPFDLVRSPLVRASLVALGPDEHVLFVAVDRAIGDNGSRGLLYRDLSALYRDLAAGKPSRDDRPLPLGGFAAFQHSSLAGEELGGHRRLWRERLAEVPYLELPTDRPRPPIAHHRSASVRSNVPGDVLLNLRSLADGEDAPIFAVLAAAYTALLTRFSGQLEFLV